MRKVLLDRRLKKAGPVGFLKPTGRLLGSALGAIALGEPS